MGKKIKKHIRNPSKNINIKSISNENVSRYGLRQSKNKLRLDFKDKEIKIDNYTDKIVDSKDYIYKRINDKDRFLEKRKKQKFTLNEKLNGKKEDKFNKEIATKNSNSSKNKLKKAKIIKNKGQLDVNNCNNLNENELTEKVNKSLNTSKYISDSKETIFDSSSYLNDNFRNNINKNQSTKYKKLKNQVRNFQKDKAKQVKAKKEINIIVTSEKITDKPTENILEDSSNVNRDKKEKQNVIKSSKDTENYEAEKSDDLKSSRRNKRKNYMSSEIFTRAKTNSNLKKNISDEKLKSSSRDKTDFSNKFDDKTVSNDKLKSIKEDDILKKGKNHLVKEKSLKDYSNKLIKGKDKLDNNISKSSLVLANYLESGSNENVGVEGTEKSLRAYSRTLTRGKRYRTSSVKSLRNSKTNIKLKDNLKSKSLKKIKSREVKNKYLEELSKLRLSSEYQKKSAFKKFLKRKQIKRLIYNKENFGVVNRLKKAAKDTLFSSVKLINSRAKNIGLILGGVLILFMLIFNLSTSIVGVFNATNSSVLTTSYLSDKDVLENVNQEYSNLEYNLQDEIDNVKENYPNYDEYIINADEIGHDTHTLLSYLTARYGVFEEDKDMNSHLLELFNEIYSLKYDEEIEIRYRTEYYSYLDVDGNIHRGSYEVPYEYKKLIVNLTRKDMDTIARDKFKNYKDNLWHYETLIKTRGNMGDYFGSGNFDEILDNEAFKNPGITFDSSEVKTLFNEAEKHIGKRYVFGANGPANFDCSSFVCYAFSHSGIKNMPRTTAWGIYRSYTTPISPSEAKAGDIIFFKNTYNSGSPISHVGIYAGNGMMIHAGDPIKYTSINTPYWREHFYGFGRPR